MPKHIKVLLLVLFAVVLLGGCAKFDATAGIDEKHNAVLQYHVSLSMEELSQVQQKTIKDGINTLIRHYTEDQGFVLEPGAITGEGKIYDFTLTKTVANTSYSQALASLEEMLTDEKQSVFMKVDVTGFHEGRQGLMMLEVELDLNKIIELSTINEFSTGLAEMFWEGVETGEGTLTLYLPAAEIQEASASTAALERQTAILKTPISFTEATHAKLVTRINSVGMVYVATPAEELLQKQKMGAIIGGGICIVGLAILGIAFKRTRKSSP